MANGYLPAAYTTPEQWRASAEALNGKIRSLRNSGTSQQRMTPRRARIVASQIDEAAKAEKVQRACLAIAEALAGNAHQEKLHVLEKFQYRSDIEVALGIRYETGPDMARRKERLSVSDQDWGDMVATITKVADQKVAFADAAKAMEMAGEAWGRSMNQAMAEAIQKKLDETAAIITEIADDGDKTDEVRKAELELVGQKIPGFFPTPPKLIELMIQCADLGPDVKLILEPSAGKGDIADAARKACPTAQVWCIEPNYQLRRILEMKKHKLVGEDFLRYESSEAPDVILMNPPFEKGQDIDHVVQAMNEVRPGGRVVAIMSEGPFFREDQKARDWRSLMASIGPAMFVMDLDDGAFAGKDSFRQTGVKTRLIVYDRPERKEQ